MPQHIVVAVEAKNLGGWRARARPSGGKRVPACGGAMSRAQG